MADSKALERRGYSLGDTLGEGSYGTIKSAYSNKWKTHVAIKIINKRKIPALILEKFLPRELEIVASLKHSNILQIFEIIEERHSKVYVVTELCEGGDLMDLIISRGALPEESCRRLFRQLCQAVRYLHDKDLVHRDLKCENLLLDKDHNLRVADFGFSRRLAYEAGRVVLSETFCGSGVYAAPEVLQNVPYNPKASDVWSMGVILYVMLYALMPYDDSNLMNMVRMQLAHCVPFPSEASVSPEVRELIVSVLHPEVTRRLKVAEVLQHPWVLAQDV